MHGPTWQNAGGSPTTRRRPSSGGRKSERGARRRRWGAGRVLRAKIAAAAMFGARVGSSTGRVRSSDGRAWHRRDDESGLTALVDKPADRVTERPAPMRPRHRMERRGWRTRERAVCVERRGGLAPHTVGHNAAVRVPREEEPLEVRQGGVGAQRGRQVLQEEDVVDAGDHQVVRPGLAAAALPDVLTLRKHSHDAPREEPRPPLG